MRNPALGQLQASILDAVKNSRSERAPSDDEIGAVLKVDRSLLSLWRSGERRMHALHLLALATTYGGPVLAVLLPSCDILPREAGTERPVEEEAALLHVATAQLSLALVQNRAADGLKQVITIRLHLGRIEGTLRRRSARCSP